MFSCRMISTRPPSAAIARGDVGDCEPDHDGDLPCEPGGAVDQRRWSL
jgi:hypothetical protein